MPTSFSLSDAALLFLVFAFSPVVLAVLPPMRDKEAKLQRRVPPTLRKPQTALRVAQVSHVPGFLPAGGERRRSGRRAS